MVRKRESAGSTRQYPTQDSKFPSRLARGIELPALKPQRGHIGPYELVAELGSGGMGTVYVARRSYEVGVTRTVALKTLRKELSQERELVEMFVEEARITARISHPYVCNVMDIGTEHGVPYVTMDYLIGEPLSRLGPLMADDRSEASLANIVRVIAHLCEGLHAAHELRDERGDPMHVVHRDISPDNLFVLYDGSVRVADFGIACTAEAQKSGKGSPVAGRIGYMAPEQLRGTPVDRRADVWSMGVVLWELLAGKRLFRPSSEIAATIAVLERPIEKVSTFNSNVPKGLDAVIARAIERERDKRYPTARAMALDLEQVLARCFGPVSAGQVSTWLDGMFPGCQAFRRTIVARAEELRAQQQSLEFAPSAGMLLSTRPPDNDVPVEDALVQRIAGQAGQRRADSLATLDVELSEPGQRSLRPSPGPAPLPAAPLRESVPGPRARLARVAAALAVVALGGALAFLFRRGEELPSASPAASTTASGEPAQAAPEPAPVAPSQVEPLPSAVEHAPVPPTTVTSPVPEPASAARPTRLAAVESRSTAAPRKKPTGEVYVYASQGAGEFEVLVRGRPVKAPALLKLPVDTTSITVRKAGGETKTLAVTPTPGRPMMLRLD